MHLVEVELTSIVALYSVDERFGTSFVKNTTWILHRLAEVSHEIENVMAGLNQPSKSEMPHMLKRILLSYHHVGLETQWIQARY